MFGSRLLATTTRSNRMILFASVRRRIYSFHDETTITKIILQQRRNRRRRSLGCCAGKVIQKGRRTLSSISLASSKATTKTSPSAASNISNLLSFDKLISLLVIGGCTTLIIQAYYEGYEPLQGQVYVATAAHHNIHHHNNHHHDNGGAAVEEEEEQEQKDVVVVVEGPKIIKLKQRKEGGEGEKQPTGKKQQRFILEPNLCRKLSKDGYLVIDNFLSSEEIQNAIKDSLTIPWKCNPNYINNNNDTDDENDEEVRVRTDQVYFLDSSSRKNHLHRRQNDNDENDRNQHHILSNDNNQHHHHHHHHHNSLYKIHDLFYLIGQTISQSSFNGFDEKYQYQDDDDDDDDGDNDRRITTTKTKNDDDNDINYYSSTKLAIPTKMQISRYDKKNPSSRRRKSKSKADIDDTNNDGDDDRGGGGGGYYHAHLDSSYNDSIFDLGLLGYLRSEYLRRRYITCIIYLNPNWKNVDSDGGCLRIYHHKNNIKNGCSGSTTIDGEGNIDGGSGGVVATAATAATAANQNNPPSAYIDIEPIAGRLVIFDSRQISHEVRPTFQPRLACSVWLTMN